MTSSPEDESNPLRRLLLCPGFTGEQWQLPIDDAFGDRILIGWKTESPTVDGGLPSTVARLIATAFCERWTVTFAKGLGAPAGAGLVPRAWLLGRNFAWTSTREPEDAAAGMFEGRLFAWTHQAQIVVLSAPGNVPALAERQLALPTDPAAASALRDLGAWAVFLPGVDGDVGGLYAFEPSNARALRDALVDAAKRAGVQTDVVDEPGFARSLAW